MMKQLFIFLVLTALLQHEGQAQDKNLRYEILLNSKMVGDTLFNAPVIHCLDVSPQHLACLSDGSQIYLLGWGGITPIGNKSSRPIRSFAYTSEGLLLAVADKDLCYIGKEGDWESLVKLPSSNMSVAAGKEVVYLYDQTPGIEKYTVYALAKGGKYQQLLVSPRPVNGVCESGDSIFIAIESGIYSYSPRSKQLTPLFALDKERVITSLTVDSTQGIFYFSTPTAIYALKGSSLVKLTEEFPGSTVKYFDNGLLIFDAASKNLLRIVNIGSSIEF